MRQGLTPLTIFYHYISILDLNFNETSYFNEKKDTDFGFFENKWNSSGMLHEFNINVYGNDSAILEKKVEKIFNHTNDIVVTDIIYYLERYSKQQNFKKSLTKKINETIEIIQKDKKIIRLYISQKTKIINKRELFILIALFFSIISSILVQTLSPNHNKKK